MTEPNAPSGATPSNAGAVEIFQTIADLLDVLGEKFKPEAYRRAARSIESLTEDLGAVAARGELRSIPGVGEAIAEKIEEYLRTGSVPYFERLKTEVPPGLVELMRLPGLGPKTARRFWVELGVEGPAELRDAIAAGHLVGLKGFGEKKIDQLRSALAPKTAGPSGTRRPIEDVYPIAQSLARALRDGTDADRVEIAGSFRRARETVGDLDILVTTLDPPKAFDVFTAHPLIDRVVMRGDTKETVLLKGGLQVDLRVVRPEEFGAALVYFTGSKDHNIRLRSRARDRGLKVNEYGVYREEHRVAAATEEEVYASLELAWIPPELREDHGEIDLAARGELPALVTASDLVGDLHIHLPADARGPDLDALLERAKRRSFRYLGVVVGEVRADGTTWKLSEELLRRLTRGAPPTLRVLRALELGPGAVPAELQTLPHDYRILRPGTNGRTPAGSDSTAPELRPLVVAHTRSPEVCGGAAGAVEVGPGPERLDSVAASQVREAGDSVHVTTGIGEEIDSAAGWVALGFARRAGFGRASVLNARPWSEPAPSRGKNAGSGSRPKRAGH